MGELVREYGLIPDVVISSDAVRARQKRRPLLTSHGDLASIRGGCRWK
jgi:phosphohistidine phosphatase SixA